jgi:hypothetical protein
MTVTTYSVTYQGRLYIQNAADYAATQAATSADAVGTHTFYIGQYKSYGGLYGIERYAQIYDTSDLVTEIVSAVKLRIHCSAINIIGSDFDVVIQRNPTQTYPSIPIVVGDYNKNNYSGNGGSKTASAFSYGTDPEGWNDITLDPTWIIKNGYTRLMLRSSRDIDADTPTDLEDLVVDSPELLVTHTPAPSTWRPHGGSDEDELVKAEREYQEYARKNLNRFKSSVGLFELPLKPRTVDGEWRRLRYKKY